MRRWGTSDAALWHSSAPATRMDLAPVLLSVTFLPHSLKVAGRWRERVWYLRGGNGWEARYGPQNRASQEMCLRELCEHPASLLGAHLQTSEPGGRLA